MAELVIQKTKSTARYYREVLAPGIELDMILVPGGTFTMGSPETEAERSDHEDPQHIVTVPAFFLGRYPITQAQWQIVAETYPRVGLQLNPKPSHFEGERRPVERVSWIQAKEFCARLAAQTNRPYRLPTEAEWEYACRAGTTTPFYFGETITSDLANYDWSQRYLKQKGVNLKKSSEGTTPVGSFGVANAFGLYDMHGNVWEWCQDHWHENYEDEQAPVDGSAWLDNHDETVSNASRVLRGGSWLNNPGNCRSASRYYDFAVSEYYNFGFRVVCSAARTP